MVVLLNYLPLLITLVFAPIVIWLMAKEKWKSAAVLGCLTAAALGVIMALTPSYLPKGEVGRMDVPPFEKKDFEMEDRLRYPAETEAERAERNKEMFDAVEQAKGEK